MADADGDDEKDDEILEQLFRLLRTNAAVAAVPEAMLARIASSPAARRELSQLVALMGDEEASDHADPVCAIIQAALPSYVDAIETGDDGAARFPLVHQHLESCAECLSVFEEMMGFAALPAPSFRNFAGEMIHRQGNAAASMGPATWWEPIQAHLHQLITEIEVLVGKTQATFGQMGAGLSATPMAATVLRSEGGGVPSEQVVELPHPTANFVLRLRLGPVVAAQGTIILELASTSPPAPVAGARVTLRAHDGGLLERATSDERGLVVFVGLESGQYRFAVEWLDEQWLFAVTIVGEAGSADRAEPSGT